MSETVSVRIPREQYDKVVYMAKKKGVMISWLMDHLLTIGLEAEEEWMEGLERYKKAKGESHGR